MSNVVNLFILFPVSTNVEEHSATRDQETQRWPSQSVKQSLDSKPPSELCGQQTCRDIASVSHAVGRTREPATSYDMWELRRLISIVLCMDLLLCMIYTPLGCILAEYKIRSPDVRIQPNLVQVRSPYVAI